VSWSVTGEFSPPVLDLDAVRLACRTVADAQVLALEIDETNPTYVRAFFTVPAARVRDWELTGWSPRQLAEEWERHGYDGASDIPIEIAFMSFPADKWGDARATMSFDSGHSGNGACPNIGQEILAALGDELGIECKADF
jgi:hypothetical protein